MFIGYVFQDGCLKKKKKREAALGIKKGLKICLKNR